MTKIFLGLKKPLWVKFVFLAFKCLKQPPQQLCDSPLSSVLTRWWNGRWWKKPFNGIFTQSQKCTPHNRGDHRSLYVCFIINQCGGWLTDWHQRYITSRHGSFLRAISLTEIKIDELKRIYQQIIIYHPSCIHQPKRTKPCATGFKKNKIKERVQGRESFIGHFYWNGRHRHNNKWRWLTPLLWL